MKIKNLKTEISDIKNVLIEIDKVNWSFSNLSGSQLQLFKGLDATQLKSYINQLQAIKASSRGLYASTPVQEYAAAIQGLETKQAALLLSTQGLTNAQIAETLAVNESNVATNYQAMADAGLLASKQKLTVAQVQENLQTVLGAEADTSAAMASLGLSASTEVQANQTVKLTAKKLQEAVATNALTEAQAQELAMRTGVTFAMQKQAASTLPKWIATLQAGTIAIWSQVKATAVWLATNPVGWATAAIAAIGGVIAVLNKYAKATKEASDKAQEEFDKSKERVQSNKEEAKSLDELIKKYKELKSASDIDSGTRDEIKELQYDIVDLVGAEAKNIDLVNGKLEDELQKLKEISNEKSRQNVEDARDNYYKAIYASDKMVGDADKYGNDASVKWLDVASKIHKVNGFETIDYDNFVSFIMGSGGFDDIFRKNHDQNIFNMKFVVDTKDIDGLEAKIARLKELKDFLAENRLTNIELYQDVASAIERYQSQYSSEIEAANNLVDIVVGDLSVSNDKLKEITVDSLDSFEEYRNKMIDTVKSDEDIAEILSDGILSDDDIEKVVNNFMATAEGFSTWYEQWIGGIKGNIGKASFSDIFTLKNADDTLTTLGKISESIDTIQNAYKTLYNAIEEYNEEGAISIDTLQSVIALGDDWLDYLVDEQGNLKLDKESLEELTQARLNDMRIQSINNVIDNVSKINTDADATEYLTTTNYALAESYEEVAQKALESARAQMQLAVNEGTLSQLNMDAAMDKATADIDKINKLFANTSIDVDSMIGSFGKSGSSSSKKSEFSETIDYFKQRVEELKNAKSLLDASMDNVSGSFGKNNLVDAELNITEEKFKNYTDAISMYTQKANEAFSKLPADIAAKVKDGAVAITDFIGDGNKDVVEAIKDYESWAGEIADCKKELAGLQKEIRQLELEKFNNIADDFSNQFNLRGDSKDLISKQIDLLKEAGELIGESFFKAQIDQSKKQLELLEKEKVQLVNQMSSAINSGRIQKGTEEWMSMVSSLQSVDASILDCKKSIEEFDNELLSIHVEIFDRIQDQFSNLNSEISNIFDLFDEFDVSDDKGIWSKEAIAQLGLLTQQYELAQYQVQQYNNEIDELNAQYLAGRYSATEYADKLAELNDGMWDAVKSTESAKDAIMDLNETRIENQISGIEKEIDAYKELTNAQIEALKASKDLHDYEKSIAEKTKSITDLERQIAVMQNDNSAATVAKRKNLEEQLAEAKKDLEEAEYEHSVQVSEDALNAQLEAYEKERNDEIDALRESLNDRETILATSFNTVKENASVVGQEIATIATQHGVTVSNALISSWQSGEKAVASYGEVLSQNTSAFIGNVMDVENEVWNLQTQTNTTADSLAWMFSTKADNLVNELANSYYAESNLNTMTQALHDSLVNTLVRGYDVSSIVNSLNSIASSLNGIGSAADETKRKLLELQNAPEPDYAEDLLTDDVGKNVGKGLDYIRQEAPLYRLIDTTTGKTWKDNLTYDEVWELLKDRNVAMHTRVQKYASGTRNAKGGLIIKDEEGLEAQLTNLSNGRYAFANDGDQIFTKEQTDRLYDLSKSNSDMIPPSALTGDDLFKLWGNVKTQEPMVDKRMSMPVTIDNRTIFNGDINDLKHLEEQMQKIADKSSIKASYNSIRKLSEGIRF